MGGVIFDLDQTLIDSSLAESYRNNYKWDKVYELIPQFRIYDGMEKVFEFLKNNKIPTCIVTSSPSNYCIKVINHWSLPSLPPVCYHSTVNKKPHPEPILMAIQKLGVNKSKILSVGDRTVDIIASNAAGVKSVACTWGAHSEELLRQQKPSFIITKPQELIPILQTLLT